MSPAADRSLRFTGRVGDYERGRPGYPEELFDLILARAALAEGAVVADLGAGTGISAAPWLRRGLRVVAVEPNAEMRAAAARRLGDDPGLDLHSGTAEATGLASGSVDLVFAAQSFHWFEPDAARAEALRILRPPRPAALVWNARRADGTAFARDYERLLLDFGTDYREIGHRGVPAEKLARFFGGQWETHRFEHRQRLDRDGLRARLLSSSYVPARGALRHDALLADLETIFARHAEDGAVAIDYDVDLFFARLDG